MPLLVLPACLLGDITGALLAGMLGGAAGSMAGGRIGAQLDQNALQNYHCENCGYGAPPNLTDTFIVKKGVLNGKSQATVSGGIQTAD